MNTKKNENNNNNRSIVKEKKINKERNLGNFVHHK